MIVSIDETSYSNWTILSALRKRLALYNTTFSDFI